MIAIGLIEHLTTRSTSIAITYFLCQNANHELSSLQAIVKGLILQLALYDKELKEPIRRRWDVENERFKIDVTSWKALWQIFLEMLQRCKAEKVYVILDALDECQDDNKADLLKQIVQTGLDWPSKIKWLLTSRPLGSAERELLTGSDQVQVSMDLNSKEVSEAVTYFIEHRVANLDGRHKYGPSLRQQVLKQIVEKAENTYLWASLVCKSLENVRRQETLATIEDFPPGLHPLYEQRLKKLGGENSSAATGCLRLLKVMLLTYRPLSTSELYSVSGLEEEWITLDELVAGCASFVTLQGNTKLVFVHKSAQDYLMGEMGQSILDSRERYGHDKIWLSCVSHLSQCLKANIINLPPLSAPWHPRLLEHQENTILGSVEYAASFWVQHFETAKQTTRIEVTLNADETIEIFLRAKLLEWVESLGLLGKLPHALSSLRVLENIGLTNSLLKLVQDAIRVLLRHFQTLEIWPLQIYSSAIIFSPANSLVKLLNRHKIPAWLKGLPLADENWPPMVQTITSKSLGLTGSSEYLIAIKFSPDGKHIASGHFDTLRLWDPMTSGLIQTFKVDITEKDPSDIDAGLPEDAPAFQMAFPSENQIAFIGFSRMALYDRTTGEVEKQILFRERHTSSVASDKARLSRLPHRKEKQSAPSRESTAITMITVSPDGKRLALLATHGSRQEIELWDIPAGLLIQTITIETTSKVKQIFASPCSKQIAISLYDHTIQTWDIIAGKQIGIIWTENFPKLIAVSDDQFLVIVPEGGGAIEIWDSVTSRRNHLIETPQDTMDGQNQYPGPVVFSPDSKIIASEFERGFINLYSPSTGSLIAQIPWEPKFKASSLLGTDKTLSIVFSPNSEYLAINFLAGVRVWDLASGLKTGLFKQPQIIDCQWWTQIMFSPDNERIAVASKMDIKLYELASGCPKIQEELLDHSQEQTDTLGANSDDNSPIQPVTARTNTPKAFQGSFEKSRVIDLFFSENSRRMLSRHQRGPVTVWDSNNEAPQSYVIEGIFNTAALSPDGKCIALGSLWSNVRIYVWASASGISTAPRKVGEIQVFQSKPTSSKDSIWSMVFSPDGRQLAGASENKIQLWDMYTGGLLATFGGQVLGTHGMAFSPDGKKLASMATESESTDNPAQALIRKIPWSKIPIRREKFERYPLAKVWDIAAALNKIGSGHAPSLTVHKCQKFRPKEYSRNMRFSQDGRHLIIGDDRILVDDTPIPGRYQSREAESPRYLTVKGNGVYYGEWVWPLLVMPPEFDSDYSIFQGEDRAAIGLQDGRVMDIEIHKQNLEEHIAIDSQLNQQS
ncbi:hypothetical protein TWF694_004047 [Orbilia ellipsospora]|uniref:Nephrocystin 3-like N-terminal domain-containing protein n=1 Tax=Orbilia ellipsospora TaxID=2528407 RepID=A0AAV9WWX0_9PEZI